MRETLKKAPRLVSIISLKGSNPALINVFIRGQRTNPLIEFGSWI